MRVLFALDYRGLPLKLSLGDPESAAATVQGAIGYLQALRTESGQHECGLHLSELRSHRESLFWQPGPHSAGNHESLIDGINRELRSLSPDQAMCCRMWGARGDSGPLGLARHAALDMASFPSPTKLFRLVCRSRGSRGCGDPGQDRKGPDSGSGQYGLGRSDRRREPGWHPDSAGAMPGAEAAPGVQRLALDLRQRGIVLAVSSKNTDEVGARAV